MAGLEPAIQGNELRARGPGWPG